MQFTKEQLIAHTEALIESQRQCIPGANAPENVCTYEMDVAVLEIALAALTTPDDIPPPVLDAMSDMCDAGFDAQGIWDLCKAEITGKNESQPCPRCGVTSTRPNGEHYCHANGGKADSAEPVYQIKGEKGGEWHDFSKLSFDEFVSFGGEGRILYTAHPVPVLPLSITLPDTSSKAFWSGTGKKAVFHPETYKRWAKEAIERFCMISGIAVEVK